MNLVKALYKSEDYSSALSKFEKLKEQIKTRYSKVIKLVENNESLFMFYKYPPQIRNSIYSTNLVEGLNKQLKRK